MALSKEQMDNIRKPDIKQDSALFDSWNIFLFSYYNMGMNSASLDISISKLLT